MSSCFGKLLSRNESNLVNTTYKLISEFEKSSEKECAKSDKENEKIYSKLLTQAQKAQDAIKNSGLSMNLEVPIPPRPSNRDRYILWKKRNVEKRVIDQTEAVLYLQTKGYEYNIHYEAYQAIDLAAEIRKNNKEEERFEDNSKDFSNVYTAQDKNILRRRSIRALSRNDYNSQAENNRQIHQPVDNHKQNNRVSLYGFNIDQQSSSSLTFNMDNNNQEISKESFTENPHNYRTNIQEIRNIDKNEQYMIQSSNNQVTYMNPTINDNIIRSHSLPCKPSAPPVTSSIIMPSRIRSQEIMCTETHLNNSNFEPVKMPSAPSAPPASY